jgi:H+/Cl- antiporter ClcA
MANKTPATETVAIRRAPKFFPFLVTGAVIGLLIAGIWFLIAGDPTSKDGASVLALIALIGVGLGALFGVAAALVVERVFAAKTKQTQAAKLEG